MSRNSVGRLPSKSCARTATRRASVRESRWTVTIRDYATGRPSAQASGVRLRKDELLTSRIGLIEEHRTSACQA
jgi:hypothetical protein